MRKKHPLKEYWTKPKRNREAATEDRPFKSTRVQTSTKSVGSHHNGDKTAGHLHKRNRFKVRIKESPSFLIALLDWFPSFDGTGRCDDGSEESLVSPKMEEKAVV